MSYISFTTSPEFVWGRGYVVKGSRYDYSVQTRYNDEENKLESDRKNALSHILKLHLLMTDH